jgi:hypothetical protein
MEGGITFKLLENFLSRIDKRIGLRHQFWKIAGQDHRDKWFVVDQGLLF